MLSKYWVTTVMILYPVIGTYPCILLLFSLYTLSASVKPRNVDFRQQQQQQTSLGKRGSVAVIGCGASGLASMKELAQVGFHVTGYDQNSAIGGAFSTAYSGLMFTSSTLISQFSDHFDEGPDRFWTQQEYLDYLASYVEVNFLTDAIHLNHRVTSVDRNDDNHRDNAAGYTLTVECTETGQVARKSFDRVVWATGVNHVANEPRFVDQQIFRGSIVHSSTLRGVDSFAGKRVLVVGGGETGTDLCLLLGRIGASQVASCIPGLRKRGYFVQRFTRDNDVADVNTSWALHGTPTSWRNYFFSERLPASQQRSRFAAKRLIGEWNNGKRFTRTYGTKTMSLASAVVEHGCLIFESGIQRFDEHSVHFQDGSSFACDVVILATGFRTSALKRVAKQGRSDRLFFHTFPVVGDTAEDPMRCAVVGYVRPAFGSIPPIAELQARWVARVWASGGDAALPSAVEMHRQIEKHMAQRIRQFGAETAARRSSLEEFLPITKKFAELVGCEPDLLYYFLADPQLWYQLVLGPLSSFRWRLNDPATRAEARKRIMRQPVGNLSWIAFKQTWWKRLLGIESVYL